MKKYFEKGSKLIALIIAYCLIVTACQESDEGFNDLSVAEPANSLSATNLYFFGNSTEFAKFTNVEITHIQTDEALEEAFESANDSYALFVGSNIDVRAGFINNLRNAGISVTQFQEQSAAQRTPNTDDLIASQAMNSPVASTPTVQPADEHLATVPGSKEDEIHLVTYLSVRGEREVLGSTFYSMQEAVSGILKWSNKAMKNKGQASMQTLSTNKTREIAMNFNYTWSGVADFAVDTEIFKADTPGYMIHNGSVNREHPTVFIYEHKLSTMSLDFWLTTKSLQVIQQPYYNTSTSYEAPYAYSLREFSPIASDNNVLDGRTGSDSHSYGISFGLLDGSVGGGADWSHTTDWSIPASQVNTYHRPAEEKFNVYYDIDTQGSWVGNSITVENYTYYAASDAWPLWGTDASYYFAPIRYYVKLVQRDFPWKIVDNKDILFEMDTNGSIYLTRYHKGVQTDPNDFTQTIYSW